VNKDVLKNLRDFNFSFWSGHEDTSRAVSCSYSKFVETEDGFSRSETFYLSKGDSKMDEKIQKQLQEYFGKDEEIDFEKAEENEAIVKALETVNEYQEDFPDDLKAAVGLISKQTGFCDTLISKVLKKKNTESDKTGVEKAGAKLSKETLKKIQDALTALKSILPELKENTEKRSEVEKIIADVTTRLDNIEKKKDDTAKDELAKTIEELTKRLETVEKGTGVKKSVEGQDNDDASNKDGKKWPSFS